MKIPACLVSFSVVLTILLPGTQALAFTIQNKTNGPVRCAVVLWGEGGIVETHHWYHFENGASWSYAADFAYCEDVDDEGSWWGDPQGENEFCVTRGEAWIDPIFNSDSSTVCQAVDGDMAEFKYLSKDATWTLVGSRVFSGTGAAG